MGQLNKIRFADGTVLRPGEWTASPLYSSIDIDDAAALTDLEAFSYALGGEVPGSVGPRSATKTDTNVRGQGSVLPQNEELKIFGLSIELFQRQDEDDTSLFFAGGQEAWAPDPPVVSLTNALRVQRDTLIEMRIANTKEYLQVPISFLPAARGVYHTLGSARSEGSGYTEGVAIGANGGVSEGDHRLLATPQQVSPGEGFEITFRFPPGSISGLNFGNDTKARITARVYTRGIRRRPVA